MKKRTTSFLFNRCGIKVVIWKKEHRPQVTREQYNRARTNMIELCKQ